MPKTTTVHAAGALAALAILLLAATAALNADEAGAPDYEQARDAVDRGQAIPLARILELVAPRLDGEIVGIELEREGPALIYELKIIKPNGRLTEVKIEAATGKILNDGSAEHADPDR